MQIKVLSIKKELPISCSFKLIKPDTKYDSSMSGSKIGKYDTCKKRTQVDFNFMAHNSGGPTLSTVSIEEYII